jgi:branched-chain amino acid transport system substrate-binding protein
LFQWQLSLAQLFPGEFCRPPFCAFAYLRAETARRASYGSEEIGQDTENDQFLGLVRILPRQTMTPANCFKSLWRRRDVIKLIGASAIGGPVILRGMSGRATSSKIIKIGHVTPQTGTLAPFAEADPFVLDQIRTVLTKGITNGGVNYEVQIISKDSQSNTNRASQVAADLILQEQVDLLVASSTRETTNPVAEQAEANRVPCITNMTPWQPYFFGRHGRPDKGFSWTYHFFWGLEDIIAAFLALWNSVETNRVVGALFPNDGDGNAWGAADLGFPPVLHEAGYELIDTGRFQPLGDDFGPQISAFKNAGVEIVTGVVTTPDFWTFWNEAALQGFRPKVVTVGKALLCPASVAALGSSADGLSCEIWWSPSHPFKSGLTGQSAKELCDAYEHSTGRAWTQPMGFQHALFEVAIDVLKRAKNLAEPASILEAIMATDYNSVVGPIKWSGKPVKNVSKTPLVAGQWRKRDNGFELVICEDATAPNIEAQDKLRPLS